MIDTKDKSLWIKLCSVDSVVKSRQWSNKETTMQKSPKKTSLSRSCTRACVDLSFEHAKMALQGCDLLIHESQVVVRIVSAILDH